MQLRNHEEGRICPLVLLSFPHTQQSQAGGCPSLILVSSCSKGGFPSHCHQVLGHRGRSNCWGSSSNVSGFLTLQYKVA